VHLPGLEAVSDEACYRAMDWLLAVEDKLARGVFDAVAHLLNLEVDLIFFDTTSTYFETEDADPAVWRDEHGHRVHTAADGDGDGDGDGEPVRAENPVTISEQHVPGSDLDITIRTRASMIARCGPQTHLPDAHSRHQVAVLRRTNTRPKLTWLDGVSA